MTTTRKLYGIDELRRAVNIFSHCNETFNQSYSAAELLCLADAQMRSGWDFCPDEWNERQVQEALQGTAPQWVETAYHNYVAQYLDGSLATDEELADDVANELRAAGLDVSRRPRPSSGKSGGDGGS